MNRKTSGLKAIEVCSPGASYNPVYEDHQVRQYIAFVIFVIMTQSH